MFRESEPLNKLFMELSFSEATALQLRSLKQNGFKSKHGQQGCATFLCSAFRFSAVLSSSVPFRAPPVFGLEAGNGNEHCSALALH